MQFILSFSAIYILSALVGRHGTYIVFNVFALYINIYDGSSHRNEVLVDLLFAFTSIFDLLSRFGQKKAHICLPRQCVLFSTKSAYAE